MTYNLAGGGTYTLGSSISSTDTSILLSSFLEPVSGTPYTMVLLNTDIAYGTIAPKTTQSEFISFTGITQNADGTATLTGVTRGLAKKYPFTESVTFKLPHSGQSQFILSDAPQLFNKKGTLENDEVISGYWEAPDPVTAQGLVTRDYMLNLINGGTIAVNNVIDNLAVAGEDVVAGNLLYQNTTDGLWYKTDADTAATVQYKQLGLAQGTGTTGNAIADGVMKYGVDITITGSTGLAYASNTAGGISGSTGTVERVIGMYLPSNAGLLFDPYFFYTLTKDLKDALSGGGDLGTPSTSNQFLTEAAVTAGVTTTAPVTRTYNLADSPATWTKPTGLKYIDVQLWGAGGSGGSDNTRGAGGGGGAYNTKRFFTSELGATETVTIGAGGAAATGAAGNAGGNTTFGSLLTAYGGGGGGAGAGVGGGGGGGITSAGATGAATGGAGGSPVGGTGASGSTPAGGSNFGGAGGGDDSAGIPGASVFGGGGGGAETGQTGGNSYYGGAGGAGGTSSGFSGGTSVFGGNGGAGGDASPLPTAGTVPGGGGGGSLAVGTASGAGAAGRAIVTEYYA